MGTKDIFNNTFFKSTGDDLSFGEDNDDLININSKSNFMNNINIQDDTIYIKPSENIDGDGKIITSLLSQYNKVVLSKGTYIIKSGYPIRIINNYKSLIGTKGALIKLDNNQYEPCIYIGTKSSSAISDINIEHLEIDGNKTGNISIPATCTINYTDDLMLSGGNIITLYDKNGTAINFIEGNPSNSSGNNYYFWGYLNSGATGDERATAIKNVIDSRSEFTAVIDTSTNIITVTQNKDINENSHVSSTNTALVSSGSSTNITNLTVTNFQFKTLREPSGTLTSPVIKNNGIIAHNVNNLSIINCIIKNTLSGGIILGDPCNKVVITNCSSSNNIYDGIGADGNHTDIVINNCTVFDNDTAGFTFDTGITGPILINNCTIRNNLMEGIFIRNAQDISVTNSSIKNNGDKGIALYKVNNTNYPKNIKISDTTFRSNVDEAITASYVKKMDISSCTFIDNGTSGTTFNLKLEDACENVILNGCNFNTKGIYIADGSKNVSINSSYFTNQTQDKSINIQGKLNGNQTTSTEGIIINGCQFDGTFQTACIDINNFAWDNLYDIYVQNCIFRSESTNAIGIKIKDIEPSNSNNISFTDNTFILQGSGSQSFNTNNIDKDLMLFSNNKTKEIVTFDNNKVGIGTDNPIVPMHIRVDGTSNNVDASDSAGRFDDYHLIMNKIGGTSTGSEIGLGFDIQGNTEATNTRSPGASITHERTGSYSKGKIHFKTKTTIGISDYLTTAMTINDNSNVGIGTTNPSTKLHITSPSYDDFIILDRSGVGKMGISATNPRGIQTTDGNGNFIGWHVKSDGNVGIGTTNPSAKLHIHNNGEALRLQGSSTGSQTTDEHTYMSFYPVNNTDRYGYIGYTTSGTEDLSIWNQRNGNLKFSTNNTEIMRISNSGNVGIGTTSPSEKLEVNGNILSRGDGTVSGKLILNNYTNSNNISLQSPTLLSSSYTLTLPSTDGNSDQILKTNGSGVLDWVYQTSYLSYSDTSSLLHSFPFTEASTLNEALTNNGSLSSLSTVETGSSLGFSSSSGLAFSNTGNTSGTSGDIVNCDFTTSLEDTGLSYSDALIAYPFFDSNSAPTYDNQTRLLLSYPFAISTASNYTTNRGSASGTLTNSASFTTYVGINVVSDPNANEDVFKMQLSTGLTNNFTFYVKYRQNNAGAGEENYPIVMNAGDSSANRYFELSYQTTGTANQNLTGWHRVNSSAGSGFSFGTIAFGEWHHAFLVADYAAGKFRIYYDTTQGILEEKNETMVSSMTPIDSFWLAGRQSGSNYNLDADYASMQLFEGALTLQEAQSWANYVDNNFSYATPFLGGTTGPSISITSQSTSHTSHSSSYSVGGLIDGFIDNSTGVRYVAGSGSTPVWSSSDTWYWIVTINQAKIIKYVRIWAFAADYHYTISTWNLYGSNNAGVNWTQIGGEQTANNWPVLNHTTLTLAENHLNDALRFDFGSNTTSYTSFKVEVTSYTSNGPGTAFGISEIELGESKSGISDYTVNRGSATVSVDTGGLTTLIPGYGLDFTPSATTDTFIVTPSGDIAIGEGDGTTIYMKARPDVYGDNDQLLFVKVDSTGSEHRGVQLNWAGASGSTHAWNFVVKSASSSWINVATGALPSTTVSGLSNTEFYHFFITIKKGEAVVVRWGTDSNLSETTGSTLGSTEGFGTDYVSQIHIGNHPLQSSTDYDIDGQVSAFMVFDKVFSLAKCQAWARKIDTQRQDLVSYDADQQYNIPTSQFTTGTLDTLYTDDGDMYDNSISNNAAYYAWLRRDDPSTYPVTELNPLQLIYTPSQPEAVTQLLYWMRNSSVQYISRHIKVSGQNGTNTPVTLGQNYEPTFTVAGSNNPLPSNANFNFTFNENKVTYEKYYIEFWDLNIYSTSYHQVIFGELNLRGVAAVTDRTVTSEGLYFDSTTDAGYTNILPYYNFRELRLKSDYTMYVRFKPDTQVQYTTNVINYMSDNSNGHRIQLLYRDSDSGDSLGDDFTVQTGIGGTYVIRQIAASLHAGYWYECFIGVTASNFTQHTTHNGTGTQPTSSTTAHSGFPDTNNLTLGAFKAYNIEFPVADGFKGYISHFKIFDGTMTAEQRTNSVTNTNDTIRYEDKFRLTMSTSTTMAAIPLTYHFKIYANSTIGNDAVIARILHGSSNPVLEINYNESGSKWVVQLSTSSSITIDTSASTGQWVHFFLAISNTGSLKVFADDVTSGTVRLVGEALFTTSELANVQEIWLGNHNQSGYDFSGNIASFHVFNHPMILNDAQSWVDYVERSYTNFKGEGTTGTKLDHLKDVTVSGTPVHNDVLSYQSGQWTNTSMHTRNYQYKQIKDFYTTYYGTSFTDIGGFTGSNLLQITTLQADSKIRVHFIIRGETGNTEVENLHFRLQRRVNGGSPTDLNANLDPLYTSQSATLAVVQMGSDYPDKLDTMDTYNIHYIDSLDSVPAGSLVSYTPQFKHPTTVTNNSNYFRLNTVQSYSTNSADYEKSISISEAEEILTGPPLQINSNVVTATPNAGDFLKWSGNAWIAAGSATEYFKVTGSGESIPQNTSNPQPLMSTSTNVIFGDSSRWSSGYYQVINAGYFYVTAFIRKTDNTGDKAFYLYKGTSNTKIDNFHAWIPRDFYGRSTIYISGLVYCNANEYLSVRADGYTVSINQAGLYLFKVN